MGHGGGGGGEMCGLRGDFITLSDLNELVWGVGELVVFGRVERC